MQLDGGAGMAAETGDSIGDRPMQERAERQMTVLINAGIRRGADDGLCRIRNVSAAGLNIETSLALDIGDSATVVLQSGRVLACAVRWMKDGRVGLSCAGDPAEALQQERAVPADEAMVAEALRFERRLPVQLAVHGFVHQCDLESISIRHAVLTSVRTNVQPPQVLTVSIPGLGDFPATARGSKDGCLLVRFNAPIGFGLLDPWLASDRADSQKRQAAR